MKAVVLCAGFGTRLGELTREIPKPMLPIEGKPLLEYLVSNLRVHGFTELAINLHFHPEVIEEHFGTGEAFGVRMTYFHERELLGTAGALANMRPFLEGEKEYLVQYGDVLTDQDFSAMLKFHRSKPSDATVLLHKRAVSNSVVKLDNEHRIVGFLERPSEEVRATLQSPWVNSGICIAGKRLLDWIPEKSPSDIPRDVLVPNLEKGGFFGFPLQGYRCAIDSAERYGQAIQHVRNQKVSAS